jgi:hypothetical protein
MLAREKSWTRQLGHWHTDVLDILAQHDLVEDLAARHADERVVHLRRLVGREGRDIVSRVVLAIEGGRGSSSLGGLGGSSGGGGLGALCVFGEDFGGCCEGWFPVWGDGEVAWRRGKRACGPVQTLHGSLSRLHGQCGRGEAGQGVERAWDVWVRASGRGSGIGGSDVCVGLVFGLCQRRQLMDRLPFIRRSTGTIILDSFLCADSTRTQIRRTTSPAHAGLPSVTAAPRLAPAHWPLHTLHGPPPELPLPMSGVVMACATATITTSTTMNPPSALPERARSHRRLESGEERRRGMHHCPHPGHAHTDAPAV